MLPTAEDLERLFPQHFILYQPRDIVSGDFYLIEETAEWKYFAVADCTGHGVPGALMSMICMEKLRDYIQLGMAPDEVLKKSNQKIRNALSQNHQDRTTHDGMEVALIRCKQEGKIRHLEFAGAGRPLWIQRAGDPKIEELKGTKAGIGGSTPDTQEFALRTLTLGAGDNLYLFSDGYPDQFSESSRRKITTRRLREMLEENHTLTMAEKGIRLNQFFLEWKGGFMQLDDVLVVGVGV